MNVRIFVASLLVSSFHLVEPAAALACVCVGEIKTMESQVANAPLVFGARVIAVEPLKDSVGQATSHVAAIRVEVLDVLRGDKGGNELRIWDQFAGGSCSLGLARFSVGNLAVVALDPKEERLRGLWEMIGIQPDASDYVFGTCQQHWRIFTTEAELRRYVRDRTKQ